MCTNHGILNSEFPRLGTTLAQGPPPSPGLWARAGVGPRGQRGGKGGRSGGRAGSDEEETGLAGTEGPQGCMEAPRGTLLPCPSQPRTDAHISWLVAPSSSAKPAAALAGISQPVLSHIASDRLQLREAPPSRGRGSTWRVWDMVPEPRSPILIALPSPLPWKVDLATLLGSGMWTPVQGGGGSGGGHHPACHVTVKEMDSTKLEQWFLTCGFRDPRNGSKALRLTPIFPNADEVVWGQEAAF